MASEHRDLVLYEKRGRIAYVTLNRPGKLNAVNRKMAQEIREIWIDFRDDSDVSVAVLGGSGGSFCAGADIEELGRVERGNYNLSHSVTLGQNPVSPSAYSVFKPIIGALKGNVMGSGFWLALECDIKIASDNTVFALPEPKIGIPTAFSGFLSRYLPRAVANELLLMGGKMSVDRAFQVGLINKIVPLSQLDAEVNNAAQAISKNAPLAVQAMKRLIKGCWDMDTGSALAYTDSVIQPVHSSFDAEEGRVAFLEKRQPVWNGK